MTNISKFVKNHVYLSTLTCGLAIVGYLGYRSIRWIVNKCRGAHNVDLAAQWCWNRLLNNFGTRKPLAERSHRIQINSDPITMGYGEYIVFHQCEDGTKKPPTEDMFNKIYPVLLNHAPHKLIVTQSDSPFEHSDQRHALLTEKLKEIDPTLTAVFVPKTLYELIFLRKCIQEDVREKNVCSLVEKTNHTFVTTTLLSAADKENLRAKSTEMKKQRRCWHLAYFDHQGDDTQAGVINVVFRLNKAILKACDLPAEGLTYDKIVVSVESQLDFLKSHYQSGWKGNCSHPGPATNFASESTRGFIKPMGIRDDQDAQIIRDAVALECSTLAARSLFIYRGANYNKDSVKAWNNRQKAYSLSYGSSLFAGCIFDGGATAFHYMRNGTNGYAIAVPYDQASNSPFFIPTTHTATQCFGDGEIFHARSKAWKNFDYKNIDGINLGANMNSLDHLGSNLEKKEMTTQFKSYKRSAFILK